MTVKAACVVIGIAPNSTDDTHFDLSVQYTGLVHGTNASGTLTLSDVDPTITSLTLEQAVKQAVKDFLTNTFGYTWGVFDSVRLVTSLI